MIEIVIAYILAIILVFTGILALALSDKYHDYIPESGEIYNGHKYLILQRANFVILKIKLAF
jgi:hypothetical protein